MEVDPMGIVNMTHGSRSWFTRNHDDDDDNVEVRLDHYLAIAYSTYLAIVYCHT